MATGCAWRTGGGKLAVYDLRTLKQANEFLFADRVSADLFAEDGKRVFVLTNDQTSFILEVTGGSTGTVASTKK
jgi:hypothetical protein